MAASNTRFAKIRSFFVSILNGIKSAWKAFRRGLKNFINAPFSWIWNSIKYLYGQIARFFWWLLKQPVLFFRSTTKWFANLTGRRVWAIAWRVTLWGAAILALGLFAAIHWPNSQVPKIETADPVVYLDQGWGVGRDAPKRQAFYYTPQGAGTLLKNMRYEWFVNLELPWGTTRFTDPLNMLSYGLQVDDTPTPANPHQLPVGFTKHFDPRLDEEVLDITCATCHTGNLRVVKDDGSVVSIRIDGGQGMHAFTAATLPNFIPVLIASMTSTLVNPFKFNRFALNVLGPDHYQDGKSALRKEFKKTFLGILKMGVTEKTHHLVPVEEGYARTDALTRIGNGVFGDHITTDNYKKIDAPVNYPPLWDIWKFDWVQYSGSVAQPMARNIGESLGVGAYFTLMDRYGRPISDDCREDPVPEHCRYYTSSRMEDLHKIEEDLRVLQPPTWPEELLGKIDMDKAAKGGIAFIRTCQGCHGPHPASPRQKKIEAPLKSPEQPHWKMKLLPITDIGTDPVAASNFVRRTFDLTPTGLDIQEVRDVVREELDLCYDRVLEYDYDQDNPVCSAENRDVPGDTCDAWDAARKHYDNETDKALNGINLSATSNGQGLNYFGLLMKRKLYSDAGYSKEKIADLNGFGALDLPQVKMVYKARPLEGMWTTAPFLHNGSVRNVYQLLSPQHERDRKFLIGRPEFDPEKLGIKYADQKNGGFWMDTSIRANSNTGHEFRDGYTEWSEGSPPQYGVIGPAYTDAERYEIIEYLKVHLDDGPLSGLYLKAFAGIISSVQATMPNNMPEEGKENDFVRAIAKEWPGGQACNLREYLGNHSSATGLSESLREDIKSIQSRLEAYFELPNSYVCGGTKGAYDPDFYACGGTRYQNGEGSL